MKVVTLFLALLIAAMPVLSAEKPVFSAKSTGTRMILSVEIDANGTWTVKERIRGKIVTSGGGGNATEHRPTSDVINAFVDHQPRVENRYSVSSMNDSDMLRQLLRRVNDLEYRESLRMEKDQLEEEMQTSLVLSFSKVARIRDIKQILKNFPVPTIVNRPRQGFSDEIRSSVMVPENESSSASSAEIPIARNEYEQLQEMIADNQKSVPLVPKK